MPKFSYLFNVADSDEGPMGLCARVDANTPEAALAILRWRIGSDIQRFKVIGGLEYIYVYLNASEITLDDISEWETEEYDENDPEFYEDEDYYEK